MYDKKKTMTYSKESLADVLNLPRIAVPGRLTEEAAKFFNIRSAVSEEDGKTPTATYFPYYDQSNKLVGFKKRDWTLEKEHDYHFTTVGKVSAQCKMFGQQKFGDKAKKVLVVEGEEDCAATWLLLHQYCEKIGINQSYAVVGLPAGCSNAKISAKANEKFLLSGEELLLALDNDERLPHEKKNVVRGKEATEDIFSVLLSDKIKKINYPEGIKDARDYARECYKKKDLKTFYNLMLYGGVSYSGSKIIQPHEISFEQMEAPIEEGVYIEEFPTLMEKLRGFRKHELTMVTAPSGAGKSTIVSSIMGGLAHAGQKIGVIYLEEDKIETLKRMQAYRMKKPFDELFFNPQSVGTEQERREAWDWVSEVDENGQSKRFVLLNHFGSILTQELMDKIKQLVFIQKCDYIILDHVSIAISGTETNNERKDVDILLTNLASFVVPNPVGIIAVSHINRQGSTAHAPRRGHEDEPYFVEVRKEHLRGSSAIEGLCWNIIGVEPEIMPDRSRGRVRLSILKNRKAKSLGVCDILRMNEETGMMEDASHEDEVKF